MLHYEHGDGLPWLDGDSAQLQQVVLNLVTNALDATRDQETAQVTLRTHSEELERSRLGNMILGSQLEAGRYVTLEVSDNGVGMTPEAQSQMFDPSSRPSVTGEGSASLR